MKTKHITAVSQDNEDAGKLAYDDLHGFFHAVGT